MEPARWKPPRPENFKDHVRPHQPWPGPVQPNDRLWSYESMSTTDMLFRPYPSDPPLLPPLERDAEPPFWQSPCELGPDPRFVSTCRLAFQGPQGFLLNKATCELTERTEVTRRREAGVRFDIQHSPSVYQENFCLSAESCDQKSHL